MAQGPRPHDPRITVIQQELFDERRSKVDKYRDLVIGQPGLWPLVRYELVMLLAAVIVGFIGDALVPGRMHGGWVGAIIAGLLGSAIGG